MQLTDTDIEKLDAIKNYLMSHVERPPILDDLCGRFAINKKKLTLGFRRRYQQSIYHFWLMASMGYARDQIRGGCQAKELAIELGYATPQSFSRAFKSIHGHTPGETRMQK